MSLVGLWGYCGPLHEAATPVETGITVSIGTVVSCKDWILVFLISIAGILSLRYSGGAWTHPKFLMSLLSVIWGTVSVVLSLVWPWWWYGWPGRWTSLSICSLKLRCMQYFMASHIPNSHVNTKPIIVRTSHHPSPIPELCESTLTNPISSLRDWSTSSVPLLT